jgi:monovalent cation:proton antiporter-2 (CPA2) family protein
LDTELLHAFVYLLAAVIAVPIARRLGLGSVLGYLLAGVVIGPLTGFAGAEAAEIQIFAEFGVVMMLFLVGLKLKPQVLWSMRGQLFGLGGLQMLLTIATITGAGMALGLTWQLAMAVSFVFSVSSTAIVLHTLGEKNLLKSAGGQASFSVLLTQDIAVIPLLAIVPLLTMPELAALGVGATDTASTPGGEITSAPQQFSFSYLAQLAGWQKALELLVAVAIVVIGGHYLSRPLFRYIASTGLREMFVATALLLVVGIALLMTSVGLSPALGTFLAGVVLATSEYRYELESDIEPFEELLLGLFFITVGAGMDFDVLGQQWLLVIGLTLGVMAIKALILFLLAVMFGLKGADRWLMFLGLAQIGEFGFVLISFSLQSSVMTEELSRTLLLVVALSMLLTPLFFIFFEKIVRPGYIQAQIREDDEVTEQGVAIIAGHGRFGTVINGMLVSNGFKTVVLDRREDVIDTMRAREVNSFFGDATHPDLLQAAGLSEAKLLVVAIDDPDQALQVIEYVRRERPDIHIVARAYDHGHLYELYQSGADDIVRETVESALRSGRYALKALGFTEQQAQDAATAYFAKDMDSIR